MINKLKRSITVISVLWLVAALLPGGALWAASTPSSTKWEIGLFVSLPLSGMDDEYVIAHSPLVYNYTVSELESTVNQLLHIKAKNALGGTLMVNLRPASSWGVQLLLNSTKINLEGEGNSYSFDLAFTYRPYPDFNPVRVNRSRQGELDDTSGSLTLRAASLNLLTRIGVKKTLNVDLSGGLTLFKLKGTVNPVAYLYHGFGRDILVSIPYSGDNSIDTSFKLGLNAGVSLSLHLSKTVALLLDCRYYFLPKVEVEISPLESGGSAPVYGISNIIDANFQPIEMSPSFLRLAAGIKIMF